MTTNCRESLSREVCPAHHVVLQKIPPKYKSLLWHDRVFFVVNDVVKWSWTTVDHGQSLIPWSVVHNGQSQAAIVVSSLGLAIPRPHVDSHHARQWEHKKNNRFIVNPLFTVMTKMVSKWGSNLNIPAVYETELFCVLPKWRGLFAPRISWTREISRQVATLYHHLCHGFLAFCL